MPNYSDPKYVSIDRQFGPVGLTFALGLVLFALRMFLFKEIFFPMILWNMYLAIIPWLISLSITTKESQIRRWIKGAVWLLFLPNAFYIATDIVHLRESTAESYWFDLVLLLTFTSCAFLLGFYSFNNIERIFNRSGDAWRKIGIRVALFMACSYGLYVGRVLRWNSWDMLYRPGSVVKSMFHSMTDLQATSLSLTISLSFFAFLYLIYHLFFILNRRID